MLLNVISFFLKIDFLNTVEAKVVILTCYVKPNETMAINRFQGQGHHTHIW